MNPHAMMPHGESLSSRTRYFTVCLFVKAATHPPLESRGFLAHSCNQGAQRMQYPAPLWRGRVLSLLQPSSNGSVTLFIPYVTWE